MILPLPLAPLEEHMLLDDRAAYPMTIFCRLRFSGRVDRPAFEAGAAAVLARHPLLRARVQKTSRGAYEWVEVEDSTPLVHWHSKPAGGGYPHMPGIDLTRERGIRVWVLEGNNATDVVMQMHHACGDGLGGFIFVKDIITAYALEKGAARRDSMRRLDEEQLRERATFGLTTRKLWGMAHKQALGLIGAAQFYFRKAVPVVPHEPQAADSPLPNEYPAECSAAFSEEESAAHLAAAERLGVTTNDLFCRDLFLALADYRAKHSLGNRRDWLRLKVPVNLRTVADRRMPVANVVSAVFLDRRDADFVDSAKLLTSIHDQMQLIKRNQLGLTLVLSFALQQKLPGGLKGTTRTDRCSCTCIVTNLGEALAKTPVPSQGGKLVAGDLVLEGYDCLPPLRPHTAAAFSLFRYVGRQFISMHYEPRVLSAEQARELLDMYAQRVRETAGSAGPHVAAGSGSSDAASSSAA